MKTTNPFVAILIASAILCPVAQAAGSGSQSVSVKMGYFNLNQVKVSFPAAAAVVSLEDHAKELLRHDVDGANTQLAEMQKQNKPKEDVEKKSKELQLEIAAKQQAMGELLSRNSAEANRAIAAAAAGVAKDKGLDIVVDASGIYAGGDKFANNGEDVTEAVINKLAPKAAH